MLHSYYFPAIIVKPYILPSKTYLKTSCTHIFSLQYVFCFNAGIKFTRQTIILQTIIYHNIQYIYIYIYIDIIYILYKYEQP